MQWSQKINISPQKVAQKLTWNYAVFENTSYHSIAFVHCIVGEKPTLKATLLR